MNWTGLAACHGTASEQMEGVSGNFFHDLQTMKGWWIAWPKQPINQWSFPVQIWGLYTFKSRGLFIKTYFEINCFKLKGPLINLEFKNLSKPAAAPFVTLTCTWVESSVTSTQLEKLSFQTVLQGKSLREILEGLLKSRSAGGKYLPHCTYGEAVPRLNYEITMIKTPFHHWKALSPYKQLSTKSKFTLKNVDTEI